MCESSEGNRKRILFYRNFLEIVPDGVSKGVAVKWLCEYLDIPLENSVAAGDAPK